MKTTYSFLAAMAASFSLIAQSNPAGTITSIRINSVSGVSVPITDFADATAEGSPLVKPGGMRSYYLTTNYSRLFPSNINLAADNIYQLALPGYNSTIVSAPLTWWGGYRDPITLPTAQREQWKRNYNGITSQHSVNIPGRGNVVLAFAHGENKNEKISGNPDRYYNNTVRPNFTIDWTDPSTYSGETNGVYSDCFHAYFGFVAMSFTDDTQNNSWGNAYYFEQGPIAWPSNGYMRLEGTRKTQASMGLRHPSSIVHNGFVYVYFQDTQAGGIPFEPNRQQGIKVVRASIANSLNPNAYEIYCNGTWKPSLPAGFTLNNMMNFINTKGPESSLILSDGLAVHFTVAKVRNTDWFIGLEEITDNNHKQSIRFRLSKDLVNWTAPLATIVGPNDYNAFAYRGAHFLDQYGWTNYEIDLHKFYVIGMAGNPRNLINRMRLDIDILQTPIGIEKTNTSEEIQTIQQQALNVEETILTSQRDKIVTVFSPETPAAKKYSIYTVYGQLVKEEVADGAQQFDMNLSDIAASGIYILRIESGAKQHTKKIYVN